ncbi:MAG TPA: PAS domain-containing sensor histidine kinase [Segetibacter sp.]|jgi:PAS domain S-box-containing protein
MFESFEPVLHHSPLFKSVFDNATINAIQVMDKDGFILQVNTAFTKSFGHTTEDLLGKHSKVLFTEEDQAKQQPEMEIEKVNQHGFAVDKNYTVHKDGSCVWVSGESTLAKDADGKEYIIKFIQDIHEQKLLEKFLKESKEFSDNVVTSITDALVVFDLNFRILKANNAFYNLLKLNEESVEGLHLFELKNSFLSSEKLKEQINKIIETETAQQFQIDWNINDSNTKHLSVKAGFLDGQNVNKRIVLVMNDITDKISSEQQRDDLLAFVIHELRNPLANITLCNSLLEQSIEDNDKEEAEDFLNKIKTNTQRIKSLIQELYDATQAGSGTLHFNKSTFSFDDLVSEVIENVQLANKSHLIQKTGKTDAEVYADRGRIGQTLSNYLLNAIKYSPEADKVDVQLTIENGNVVVAVKDYGQGIAEDKVPHVFERYYRADNTTKIEGLGLGLYLSKQIIDTHNGRVWVKSRENEGSTFYFSIPKAG